MLHTIPMVDLQAQYRRFKGEIDLAILNVLDEGIFIQGNIVREFENQLAATLNVKHVITCANGTDALQIAFMALDLPKGSEVIIPTYTYAALAEILHLLGLIPVFVDVMKDGFLMDVSQIASKITSKTKAIAPVHLFGECADLFEIIKIAKQHSLFVIEDTAQAIGSVFCAEGLSGFGGTLGDIGTTSFFPSKNLGCYGDGGAIFTNNDHLANKMRMIANHGQSQKYIHEIIGINSRLDTIQAAILRIKLPRLDAYIDARRKVADHYDAFFEAYPQIKTPVRGKESRHVFHQYTMQLFGIDRDALVSFLATKEVPSMIYYPVPAHRQKMFSAFGSAATVLPVTDALTSCVMSLPIHTEMEQEQLDFICASVAEFIIAHS